MIETFFGHVFSYIHHSLRRAYINWPSDWLICCKLCLYTDWWIRKPQHQNEIHNLLVVMQQFYQGIIIFSTDKLNHQHSPLYIPTCLFSIIIFYQRISTNSTEMSFRKSWWRYISGCICWITFLNFLLLKDHVFKINLQLTCLKLEIILMMVKCELIMLEHALLSCTGRYCLVIQKKYSFLCFDHWSIAGIVRCYLVNIDRDRTWVEVVLSRLHGWQFIITGKVIGCD